MPKLPPVLDCPVVKMRETCMYHIPERRKSIIVNPWPLAMRRILWIVAMLCGVAFLRQMLEYAADHMVGEGRGSFNYGSIYFLAPVALIAGFLILRKEGHETYDDGHAHAKRFIISAALGIGAVYLLWDKVGLTAMFSPSLPEAYPHPHHAVITMAATWFSFTMGILMFATLLGALSEARGNRYESESEAL